MLDGVLILGDQSFSNNQIASLIIPNSVQRIGQNAFLLNALTHLEIGSGVTLLDNYAFKDNQLESVTIHAINPPDFFSMAYLPFDGNQLTAIYVPAQSVNAYKTNQYWSVYAELIRGIGVQQEGANAINTAILNVSFGYNEHGSLTFTDISSPNENGVGQNFTVLEADYLTMLANSISTLGLGVNATVSGNKLMLTNLEQSARKFEFRGSANLPNFQLTADPENTNPTLVFDTVGRKVTFWLSGAT